MTTAVTKESLAARIAELESGARSLKEDYTLAAYKMLLATMEAEPVAVCIVEGGQMCPDGFGECDHSLPDGTHELFAAPQPAPVVPEEKPIPNTLSMYAVDAVAAIAEVKGWNACRAAMLNRAQEPATDNTAQQFESLAENTEPCEICGVVSSHPEGWHYCHGKK